MESIRNTHLSSHRSLYVSFYVLARIQETRRPGDYLIPVYIPLYPTISASFGARRICLRTNARTVQRTAADCRLPSSPPRLYHRHCHLPRFPSSPSPSPSQLYSEVLRQRSSLDRRGRFPPVASSFQCHPTRTIRIPNKNEFDKTVGIVEFSD